MGVCVSQTKEADEATLTKQDLGSPQPVANLDHRYSASYQLSQTIVFHSTNQQQKDSTSGTTRPISPALYRDVLHAMFQFLNLQDFVRACQVKQLWYLAGLTMKPRKDALCYRGPIGLLLKSPLRIHINQLDITSSSSHDRGLPANHLLLLPSCMAHLEQLTVVIPLTIRDDQIKSSTDKILFPISENLQELKIYFFCSNGSAILQKYLPGCLKQIAIHAKRLVKLEIDLGEDADTMKCPDELRLITSLTEISLPPQFKFHQTIDIIKSLPALVRCETYHRFYWSTEALERLVSGSGPPPRLQDIGYLGVVEATKARQLSRLSTLTTLECTLSIPDPTTLLPLLPHLLKLSIMCPSGCVNVNELVVALSRCRCLTEVSLDVDFTHDHLAQFLPYLTSLTMLRLLGCGNLVSLQFLTTARESLRHLTHLEIANSPLIPIFEYDHLCAISSSLESLTLSHSSTPPFDSLTIGRWSWGSPEFRVKDWPRLKTFLLTQAKS